MDNAELTVEWIVNKGWFNITVEYLTDGNQNFVPLPANTSSSNSFSGTDTVLGPQTNVSIPLSFLTAGLKYHFRVRVRNSAGFTQSTCPSILLKIGKNEF